MKEIVKEIISEYFDRIDEDDEILNKIIADKALEEELNTDEISRVIQMSNVKIFEKLFDATKDKTLEFDLAKPDKVRNILDGKRPETSFDDTHYEIPEPLEEEKEEKKEVEINPEELINTLDNLTRRKTELELQLGEQRPRVKREIKKKVQTLNPNSVIFAIKTSSPNMVPMVKEVCEEENLLEKEAKEYTGSLLKTSSEFLSDIKSYGRMKSELKETSEKLKKVSYIIKKSGIASGASKALSGAMKMFGMGKKLKRFRKNQKQVSDSIQKGGDKSKQPTFPSGKQREVQR